MRARFLPGFILAATIGLSLKLVGLWGDLAPAVQLDRAIAQERGLAGEPLSEQTRALIMRIEPAAGDDQPPADEPNDDQASMPAPGEPTEFGSRAALADPLDLSDEEIDLLQQLVERREQIERRDREVQQREALLGAAEGRVQEKIDQLKALQATIEGLLVKYDDQEEAQMGSLVKIYESMKPKEAARIFEQLDMAVLLEVISRMKERKIAPILAKLDPARAKTITLELARRRELPIARE